MSVFFPRFSRNIASELNTLPQLFRAFDDAFLSQGFGAAASRFAPRLDLTETGNDFHVKADVPGFARDNLNIDFNDDNVLTIRGNVEESKSSAPEAIQEASATADSSAASDTEVTKVEEPSATSVANSPTSNTPRVWHSERMVGSFSRSVTFPSAINKDAIKASLENGILSIVVPKLEAQQAKKIQIE